MAKKLFSFINNIGNLAIKIGLVIYIGVLLTRSMQANIKTNQQIESQKKEILKLKEELNTLKDQIAYFQSSSFYELEARKQLNLQADGEKVIILPSPPKQTDNTSVISNNINETSKPKTKKPNYQIWFDYYFNR